MLSSTEKDLLARLLLTDQYNKSFGVNVSTNIMKGPWTPKEDAAIRAIIAAMNLIEALH